MLTQKCIQGLGLIFYYYYFFFFFLLEYSCFTMLLVSAVQQSESATHIHVSALLWISFPSRSPQSTKESSLCCTICSHQLSILYIVSQCICVSLSLPTHPVLFSPLVSICLCLYLCFANNSKRYMHPSVHCSTFYNNQDMGAI